MPNSSANTAKMKSVVSSGRKFSRACVPFMKPLPQVPPAPIAISDWMM